MTCTCNRIFNRIKKNGVIIVLCVLAVLISITAFNDRYYATLAVIIAILSLLLFFIGVERRNTATGKLVLTSIMTAIAVIGRFIPYFKPVTAIVILTGVYLGAEAGFLAGTFTALISNFYFGQGPWTPFQMLALGLIGFVSGVLSRPLDKYRIALVCYGALSGAVYSFIMDIWSVAWTGGDSFTDLYKAALVSAIPFTISYMISNVIFLWLLQKPLGRKIKRIRKKYGL